MTQSCHVLKAFVFRFVVASAHLPQPATIAAYNTFNGHLHKWNNDVLHKARGAEGLSLLLRSSKISYVSCVATLCVSYVSTRFVAVRVALRHLAAYNTVKHDSNKMINIDLYRARGALGLRLPHRSSDCVNFRAPRYFQGSKTFSGAPRHFQGLPDIFRAPQTFNVWGPRHVYITAEEPRYNVYIINTSCKDVLYYVYMIIIVHYATGPRQRAATAVSSGPFDMFTLWTAKCCTVYTWLIHDVEPKP